MKDAQTTNDELLRSFVQAGVRAANTHNAQPWSFTIDPQSSRIAISLDRTRVLPASDPETRQSVISLGCAAENILIAAAAAGWNGEITVRETTMEILFQKSSLPLADAALAPFIEPRKVIRADFDRERKIPEMFRQSILALADAHTQIFLLEDIERRQALAELQGQADGFVINDSVFAKELGDWLLPNDTASLLGMPGAVFGIHDDQARRINRGFSGIEPLQPEDALRFALGGKRLMEQTPCIAVIGAAKDDFPHWIAAGQALERILLLAKQHNLAASIHAGMIEVPLIREMCAAILETQSFPLAVVRLGYLKYEKDAARPRTRRLPITDVIASA